MSHQYAPARRRFSRRIGHGTGLPDVLASCGGADYAGGAVPAAPAQNLSKLILTGPLVAVLDT